MPQKIKRVPYQPSESRRRTYECDLSLPEGDWVVWWYSKLRRNGLDHTVPLAFVVFRRLHGDMLTDDFQNRKIALSRLNFYQPGYVLVDSNVVARIATESQWFDVDFSYAGDAWKFESVSKLRLSQANSSFFLPSAHDEERLLSIKIESGRLLLNCVEFLVRGFSRRSEIPRILATYGWDQASTRLFSQPTPREEKVPKWKDLTGNEKWIVYPHKNMVKDDDIFLAHVANEPTYAGKAAKGIFTQLESDEFRFGKGVPLEVSPWFNSKTRLKCRGFWIDDGKSFYCTELVGMKEPEGFPVEARRDSATKTAAPEDRLVADRLRLLRDDPITLALTDLNQPRSDFPREEIEDSSFEIEEARKIDRFKVPTLSGRQKYAREEAAEIEDFSTGEPAAQRNSTTGKAVLATREFGVNSQGVLYEMWASFRRLLLAGEIQDLRWLVPPDQAHESSDFQCISFTEDPKDVPRSKWLSLKKGGTRGLLLMLVRAEDDLYLVVEIERDVWVDKNGDFKEDTYSGFISPVANLGEAMQIHRQLNDYLPSVRGVFANIEQLPSRAEFFEHRPTGNPKAWFDATAVLALRKVGVVTSRPDVKEEDQQDSSTEKETAPKQ